MDYEYVPPSLKKKYENEKYMIKNYGTKISHGMLLFLGAVCAAENAYDLRINHFFVHGT